MKLHCCCCCCCSCSRLRGGQPREGGREGGGSERGGGGSRGGGGVVKGRRGEQGNTHGHTNTCRDARIHAPREAPPLPRFPVAYPSLGPPSLPSLPSCCTLPAFIHAASGALAVVFPRRSRHWLITSAWPIKTV